MEVEAIDEGTDRQDPGARGYAGGEGQRADRHPARGRRGRERDEGGAPAPPSCTEAAKAAPAPTAKVGAKPAEPLAAREKARAASTPAPVAAATPPRRPMVEEGGCSPRRSPVGWRRKAASISARSPGPARTAVSSRPISMRPSPARRRWQGHPQPRRRRLRRPRSRPAWPTPDPQAVRGGELRDHPARQCAEDHRQAAGRGEDHDPALLPDRRHRDRFACSRSARDINAAAPIDKDKNPAWKVSVNDMVIKALAMALQRVPDANVTWTEGGMLRHKHSDIGVAVSIPGGLITPVVRHAEEKRLSRHLQRDEGPRAPGAVAEARPA